MDANARSLFRVIEETFCIFRYILIRTALDQALFAGAVCFSLAACGQAQRQCSNRFAWSPNEQRNSWLGKPRWSIVSLMDHLIEKEGFAFWKALQQRLAKDAEALPEEYTGSIIPFGGGFRITISRIGMAFKQSHTDLFYKREVGEIRCSTLNTSPYALKFCANADDTVSVKSTLQPDPMNVDQASEHILRVLLDVVGRK